VLDTVVFRREGEKYAQTHIVERNLNRAFCGAALPPAVLEDTRRTYYNKGNVTCATCLTEWAGGRSGGYRPENAPGGLGAPSDATHSDPEA